MSDKYKVVCMHFVVPSPISPYRIIKSIAKSFDAQGNIVSLKAFPEDNYICTLCTKPIVDEVLSDDSFLLGSKYIEYKIIDTNMVCIKIEIPYYGILTDDINRILRAYGTVFLSEISSTNARMYYAIMEIKRNLPRKVKCRMGDLFISPA
ncbi:uncharacterized protein TNCV_1857101 [Trichonephila clavipes]|nr:uncharacterized protein TNCV_1857101 [Trichonephila clavipes]